MRFPIKWHRGNMAAMLQTASAYERRAKAAADALRSEVAFLQTQIAEAERRGMDGFDSDKLLKKRKT
jgi:hypothetical protein